MKYSFFVTLNLAALLAAGCSSTPTRVDTGRIHAATFSFVQGHQAPPEYAEQRAHIHTLIQNAITTNLMAKGLSRVPSGGDVFLAYLLILGNNVATTDVDDYFGYGRDSDALLDKAHQKFAINSKNPNPFVAGTLVIDVIDAKTFKLLYRNNVARQVLRNVPDDVRTERIQEAVDAALQDVRIAH